MLTTAILPILSLFSTLVGASPHQSDRYHISSAAFQTKITPQRLLEHAYSLSNITRSKGPDRFVGSTAQRASLEYIKNLLDSTGYYKTEYQDVPFTLRTHNLTLSVHGKALPGLGIDRCVEKEASGPLFLIPGGGCTAAEFAQAEGKIVLIIPGQCAIGQQVALAGGAQATGVLFVADVPNGAVLQLEGPSRPEGPYVPCGVISVATATSFRPALDAGEVLQTTLRLSVASEQTIKSANLHATTRAGNQSDQVVLGGHSDSVEGAAGINDNISGSATILELAIQLTQFKTKNAIRFSWWTAEEVGLKGSQYFISTLKKKDLDRLALYINLDMIASPNAGYFLLDGSGAAHGQPGPAGSDHIERTFAEYFKSAGIKTVSLPMGGDSDHGTFLEAGIPTGYIFTGAGGNKTEEEAGWWKGKANVAYDACYHQACDGIDNINLEAWVLNSKAVAHAISVYANSLDGISRTHFSPPGHGPARRAASHPALKACGHGPYTHTLV